MNKLIAFLVFFCIVSFSSCKKDKKGKNSDVNIEGLFLGVVGFNKDVTISSLTTNRTTTESAIDKLENKVDQTALCYGIKKGIDELTKLNSTQALDQAFIVAFTDGYDNYSGTYFPQVGQGSVVSHTSSLLRSSLISGKPIKTYTVAFKGNGTVLDSDLQALAVNGDYSPANSPKALQDAFQSIAKSLISTSSNFSLSTSYTSILANDPKYFQITFNTYANSSATGAMTPYTILAQFTNAGGNTPIFKVTSSKVSYINFVGDNGSPITGSVQGSKYVIPFANLSITSPATGANLFIKDIIVANKFGSNPYTIDVEDSKATSAIARNVGVVLVLDCSTSLGDIFPLLKQYSREFIATLAAEKTKKQ